MNLVSPGGAVAGSAPANVGDTGSIAGLGGSHVPRGGWARAPRLLGLRSGARELQLLGPACLEPVLRRGRGRGGERPGHRNED